MENTQNKITNTVSTAFKGFVELAKERVFPPMYFYFFIAWAITNWKFIYVLFFANEEAILQTHQVLKVDYLTQIYDFEWFAPFFWSVSKLVVIPFITSFVVIWWLSRLSEVFFDKYETHQAQLRGVKRRVDYEERFIQVVEEREIREQESDNQIKYEDNEGFNEWLDENNEEANVAGTSMLPSEVLYKTDYLAYKSSLTDYFNEQAQMGEDMAVQMEIDKQRGK